MSGWLVLLRKEMLELWRSHKWLWVPLVFAILGALQPLAAYYMPQILDTVGGLPEGTVIEIPLPQPGAAVADSLNQIGTLGVLILALAGMGMVAAERSSGAAAMILVKPVSRGAYLAAKWAAYSLLMIVALGIGQAAAWYYTDLLIGPVPIGALLGATGLFAVWLCFLVTMLIALGVVLRSAAAVAALTIAVAVMLSLLTSVFPEAMAWSPSRLGGLAGGVLMGASGEGFVLPLVVCGVAIGGLLSVATLLLRRGAIIAS